ncbi:hypothetical protein [Puniceibacterium sp. IMCC21224]|uniref:hypothetical protein n=1 Tax=Puniceibacterium sp. IMCC21224 TaxID=1618204 RepID=UPI00064DBEC9|nr:hypothetical protein [Puniceibacterium sp. IMCC21224]KMK68596.1 hypothetical protein IMCC21224_113479 [Puniceibacterium sp. IMCC21224]
MGHIRLGTLPQSRKWRDVVRLLDSSAPLEDVAQAAARASETDLRRASDDPNFQFVTQLLVHLPLLARAPGYEAAMADLGIAASSLDSLTGLLAGVNDAIGQHAFEQGRSSDAGEMAKAALIESLSAQMRDRLPTLFDPTPQEIRKVLASFASGQNFAILARHFFARLSYRSLDYYLSRELANHTGAGKRFADDARRTEFSRALSQHTFEASRTVETYAGGWYGKTVWKEQTLSQDKINDFTRYAFKKMRSELGRRRTSA